MLTVVVSLSYVLGNYTMYIYHITGLGFIRDSGLNLGLIRFNKLLSVLYWIKLDFT